MGMASQFHHQVVNDNLQTAIDEVDKLILARTTQSERV
jgi:guanylate kinase